MKKNSFGAVIVTLLVGAVVAIGCGGGDGPYILVTVSSICDDVCACARCTSNDLAACEDDTIAMADAASEAGCSNEFEDVVACVSANLICVRDEAVTVGCDAEQEALDLCAAGLDPFRPSLCELAASELDATYADCGVLSPRAIPPRACTDSLGLTLECVAKCYEEASCAYLQCDDGDDAACDDVSPEEALAFADCIILCP